MWDTIGQEKFREVIKMFIKESDYVVLGYDITSRQTFKGIKDYWYPTSKELTGSDLVYLLANKSDLYLQEEVEEEIARKYAEENNIRFFRISCKDNSGINEFLDNMINEIIKK